MSVPVAGGGEERRGPAAGGLLLILVGLVLCTAAVVLFAWSLYNLTRIGTCASGGPYVSARPCPPGTGLKIMAIFGAVIAGLAGVGLYTAGWSRAGRSGRAALGLGTLMWSFTFLGAAAAVGLAAFGPAAVDDGGGAKIAATTLFVVFIPMGLAPLLFGLIGSGERRRTRERRAARATAGNAPARLEGIPGDPAASAFGEPGGDAPPGGISVAPAPPRPAPAAPAAIGFPAQSRPAAGSGADEDPVAQLERLAKLREAGAIDAAEFERLKDKILGGDA